MESQKKCPNDFDARDLVQEADGETSLGNWLALGTTH